MLDILVTCHAQPQLAPLSLRSQVLGRQLAHHFQRCGIASTFQTLPCRSEKARFTIFTDFPVSRKEFDLSQGLLAEIDSWEWYCVSQFPAGQLIGDCSTDWFAAQGGVLCHFRGTTRPAPFEHYVGIGVDLPDAFLQSRRNVLLFDFRSHESSFVSISNLIASVRLQFPDLKIIGAGSDEIPQAIKSSFDAWWTYSQPHSQFLNVLRDVLAIVPVSKSQTEHFLAEAQVAGCAVLVSNGKTYYEGIDDYAAIPYDVDSAASFMDAVQTALSKDKRVISRLARKKFNYTDVVSRIMQIIQKR